jgi:hypothetical protein
VSEHPRRAALEAVRLLLDQQTSAGMAVYVERVGALPDGTTRAVLVNIASIQTIDEESTFSAPTMLMETLVTAIATTPDGRDDLSYEVEAAMAKGFGSVHRGIAGIAFGESNEGQDDFFVAAMTYHVVYSIGESAEVSF